jgi:cytochrome o ubiquinol oxidase subunit III
MSEVTLTAAQIQRREEHLDADDKTIFGFWMYLMTDCVLFAGLFATYAVLHNNTYGRPSAHALLNLHTALAETLILLTSSFTCGLGVLAAHQKKKHQVLFWLAISFALGIAFLTLELTEFRHLVVTGNSWRRSGFLSAFFTLVGTHGLHIAIGLLWMAVMMVQVLRRGLSRNTVRRLTMFSMFWHFLDVIWIFIFTIVYLMAGLRI